MKDLFRFLRRFVPPYRGYLVMGIVANVLAAILNLLSFSLIMPILEILFGIKERVHTLQSMAGLSWGRISDWGEIVEVLRNNFSYYVGSLADEKGVSYTLMLLSIYLIVMTALKVGATYLSFLSMIPIRTGVVRDMRLAIYDKLLNLPLGYFSSERKGDILARITGDVGEVENSIMSSLDLMLKNPILITFYLGTMIIISWELTVFVFLVLPIAGYIMGRVSKTLKRNSLDVQDQWGGVLSMVEETLSGLRIIKAFTSEAFMQKRFTEGNNKHRSSLMNLFRRQQLAHPMSEFLGTVTIAIVLWYGGTLIASGESKLQAPSFIYYLVIFYSLINPLKELSKGFYTIRKGMGSMERVDKIMLAENTIPDPEQPQPLSFEEGIEFVGVSFRYGERWVLRDINLSIRKGQTVALVGASGSGKTTLVDLIPRFYDVVEGAIRIDGTDIRQVSSQALRSLMGNVSQEPILFNDTIANNISFGYEGAKLEDIQQAARIAHAEEFIVHKPEGYETNIGDRGSKLSGGQRQRLSIARAVFKNPPIMILDEATSALDTASERLVQDALDRLMQDRTTIVIAHRLSTIINADLICVMHEGQIVERGTHSELLEQGGYYSQLYNLQLKGQATN